MDQTSGNALLLRFINSSHFNIYYSISYLVRYADNIGIQHYICAKLARNWPLDELKFFIPQFVQLLLTVETESMALEELLKELCARDVHFSIVTFWHLQANLQELSKDCGSLSFQICKRLLNDLQYQLFNIQASGTSGASGASGTPGTVARAPAAAQYRENVAPSIVLASAIAASVGLPQVNTHIAPLVRTQGKASKSLVFEVVKGLQKQLNRNLTLKNTRKNAAIDRVVRSDDDYTSDDDRDDGHVPRGAAAAAAAASRAPPSPIDTLDFGLIDEYADAHLPHLRKSLSSNSLIRTRARRAGSAGHAAQLHHVPHAAADDMAASMPNLSASSSLTPTVSKDGRYSSDIESVCDSPAPATPKRRTTAAHSAAWPTPQKIKLLKSNYFKCETQFAIALQNISIKLAQVPKEARLSSLRAELSILNKDLPCETDIPVLLPSNAKGRLHKIVRIPPNEAAVLNSAERVPFLLLVEYLGDEMDFDPATPDNERLLREITHFEQQQRGRFGGDGVQAAGTDTPPETVRERRYVFDLAGAIHVAGGAGAGAGAGAVAGAGAGAAGAVAGAFGAGAVAGASGLASAFGGAGEPRTADETDIADFSVVRLSNKNDTAALRANNFINHVSGVPVLGDEIAARRSTEEDPVTGVRTAGLSFQPHYKLSDIGSPSSDLVTQMRIAAVMLTQLDASPNQLPQDQAAAIKARIIASMQALQDNFGNVKDLENIHGAAGERKLENDLKMGGVKSDLNNQSNYYLGEDWATKKERIRKESAFGHLDNWDLCSVIAKTGDDLTQEAFACQLIQAMSQIWARNSVGVWVKKMRILVTSSSTGLVETITNALSIHSIKKALTQYSIEHNDNPKESIATLKDHFQKTFGDPDSLRYKRAQDNFTSSLAAYSIICYILQIKDRHNGNIMLDNEGHIIHIDFGFLLSNSPGSMGFESAPFKLTLEYLEILGPVDSFFYQKFVTLMKEGFKCLRKNAENLITMVELMQKDSSLPCFRNGDNTSVQLRQRLQLHLSNDECDQFVENFLIAKSAGSISTRLYDQFQLLTQGIYS